MPLFAMRNRTRSQQSKRLYASFELAHTLVDFAAAIMFLTGSLMFFQESLKTAGTWCFVIGSLLFASKPTLRIIREVRLMAEGNLDDLANKMRN